MKKITYIILLVLFTSAQLHADNTYNFYFNDDENKQSESSNKEEKKVEKTAEVKEPAKEQVEEVKKKDELSKDEISELADEIAQKIKAQSTPLLGETKKEMQAIKLPSRQYQGTYYLGFGIGADSFYENSSGAVYLIKAKLFPYVAFEAALPNRQLDNYVSGYRVGANLEAHLFEDSALSLNIGAVEHVDKTWNNSVYDKVKETNPYVGLGLRLRLKNLDITGSVNKVARSSKQFGEFDVLNSNSKNDYFATVGVTYAIF